jgi:hypothetical protein
VPNKESQEKLENYLKKVEAEGLEKARMAA